MNSEDVKEIISLLADEDISELAIERGNESLKIKRSRNFADVQRTATTFPAVSVPSRTDLSVMSNATTSGALGTTSASSEKRELHVVKSGTVGIFRESKASEGQRTAEPGGVVKSGQLLGYVEILRLLTDVQSEVTGEIMEKLVSHGQPVEYGQVLYTIRPTS